MGNKLKLKPNQEFNFLGYRFNLNKGEVSPTEKKFNFLGYRFDLNKGEVSPTEKKWQILTKAIEGLQTNVFHRDSNIAREDSSNGQATHEAISMVSENPLEISPIFLHSNTMPRDLEKASELVERPKQYVGRLSSPCRGPQFTSAHRCVHQGLGSTFGTPASQWFVVGHRDKSTYKHFGIESSFSDNKIISNTSVEQEGSGLFRLRHSGDPSQQTRGDPFLGYVSDGMTFNGFLQSQSNFAEGSPHSGLSNM